MPKAKAKSNRQGNPVSFPRHSSRSLARGQSARPRKQTCKATPTAEQNVAVNVEAHVPTDTEHGDGNLPTGCQVAGNPAPELQQEHHVIGFSNGFSRLSPSETSNIQDNVGQPCQNIWIVGSSIIKRAEAHAKTRPMGRHLGLQRRGVTVFWAGHPGLHYRQLYNIISSMSFCLPPPSFIVLHFGGNDIGLEPCGVLRHHFKEVISQIMRILPRACIVWSSILPRFVWRYSENNKAMDENRKRINRALIYFLAQLGHKCIKHPDFQDKMPALFSDDGVHLSYIGNDIFLNTIQGAIETFLTNNANVYPID
ncbi:uncharacterized protein LOC132715170 [Ruditapes philippinarum]|uniref:uncharacterized protein LOC132715170 n=1 Tax=Ruditapes philippinarum TaxID=129788 RepID=UPI00295B0CF6|nr:uncharacterized protein LOC132715170 [Ruditapes philippinarum]